MAEQQGVCHCRAEYDVRPVYHLNRASSLKDGHPDAPLNTKKNNASRRDYTVYSYP